jgi:soluble lytic murein transglycosylase
MSPPSGTVLMTMRGRRIVNAAARTLVATVVLVAGGTAPAFASDGARRLVDAEGVLHLTNVPADPRYRGLSGASGTSSGWLRMPERRPARYIEDIHAIARQYGVNPVLVEAVVRMESGFDPRAVSPKGAGGLMQLMPGTASALGVVDRFNPRENINGGVRHLRYLLDRYQGSVALAVAAYNAGEGAVDTHRGIPPYPETQRYVQQVLRHAGMGDPGRRSAALYRYTESDGTPIYSNFPPRPGPRPSQQ